MKWTSFGIAALLCVAGCGKPAAPEEADKKTSVKVDLAVAKTGAVDDYLNLDGSFESGQGSLAKLSAGVQGRVKAIYVKEGTQVKKGQLLAVLDASVQTAQESSARAALESAKTQLDQSQIQLSTSKSDQTNNLNSSQIALQQARSEGQSAVAQAQFTLEQSRSDLAKLKNGARPLELAQAHETTVQADANLRRARTELQRDDALWPEGFIARKQLDDARTAVETSSSTFNAARDAEELLKAGPRSEEVMAAQSKVEAASSALDAAKKAAQYQLQAAQTAYAHAQKGVLSVSSKAQDVANGRALLAQKSADLAASQATASLLQIRAPFDGKVVKRSVSVGDPADPATTLFVVLKAGGRVDFVATALPEQALPINPGMEAKVGLSDQSFDGAVTSVSPAEGVGNLSTVRISVMGFPPPGSFGVAHIVRKKVSNAILVPDGAIVEKDGKQIVFRNDKGTAKSVDVKVGASSGGFTAVLSGLNAGDSVVASGGNELDDGAAIVSAADEDKGDAKDKDDAKNPDDMKEKDDKKDAGDKTP